MSKMGLEKITTDKMPEKKRFFRTALDYGLHGGAAGVILGGCTGAFLSEVTTARNFDLSIKQFIDVYRSDPGRAILATSIVALYGFLVGAYVTGERYHSIK